MKIGRFDIDEPVPSLHEPHVITILRPWLDAGSVGTLSLSVAEDHFQSQPFGRLEKPGAFFDFTRYRPMVSYNGDDRVYNVPNVHMTHIAQQDQPDLLFTHLLEPHVNAEEYIESLVLLFKELGVKRLCRLGGMWDAVPHTRPLPVNRTGQGRRPNRNRRYEGPTSIMNVLFEALEKENIEVVSFMVRLPYYAQLEEDYAGVARLLESLGELYTLPNNLVDQGKLQQQKHDVEAELTRNPSSTSLVRRLEAEYDAQQGDHPENPSQPSAPMPLSPEIERFLRELGESS